MKNILLVLILLSATVVFAQTKPVAGSTVIMKESVNNDWKFSNDTLSVSFNPTDYFWRLIVKNTSDKDVSIIWDKSSFVLNGSASKIIFDNTINLKKDDTIPDDPIPADSHIWKEIYPANLLGTATPTISKRFVKKRFEESGIPDKVKIVLAFEVDGNPHKYDFNFEMTPYVKPKRK